MCELTAVLGRAETEEMGGGSELFAALIYMQSLLYPSGFQQKATQILIRALLDKELQLCQSVGGTSAQCTKFLNGKSTESNQSSKDENNLRIACSVFESMICQLADCPTKHFPQRTENMNALSDWFVLLKCMVPIISICVIDNANIGSLLDLIYFAFDPSADFLVIADLGYVHLAPVVQKCFEYFQFIF